MVKLNPTQTMTDHSIKEVSIFLTMRLEQTAMATLAAGVCAGTVSSGKRWDALRDTKSLQSHQKLHIKDGQRRGSSVLRTAFTLRGLPAAPSVFHLPKHLEGGEEGGREGGDQPAPCEGLLACSQHDHRNWGKSAGCVMRTHTHTHTSTVTCRVKCATLRSGIVCLPRLHSGRSFQCNR